MNFKQLLLFGFIAGSLASTPMVSAMDGAGEVTLESLGAQALCEENPAKADGFTHYAQLGNRFFKIKLNEDNKLDIQPMTSIEVKAQFSEGELFGLRATFNERPDAVIAGAGLGATAAGKLAGLCNWKTGFTVTGLAVVGNRAYELWKLYGFGNAAQGIQSPADAAADGDAGAATAFTDAERAHTVRPLPATPQGATVTVVSPVPLRSMLRADLTAIMQGGETLSEGGVKTAEVTCNDELKTIADIVRLNRLVDAFYKSNPATAQQTLDALTDALGLQRIQVESDDGAGVAPAGASA